MRTIFIDMDGTVASYNTHDDKVNVERFDKGFFKHKSPVIPVINQIHRIFKSDKLAILSAVPYPEAVEEKNYWLDRHFNILDRYFIDWYKENKVDFLRAYKDLTGEETVLIDDEHSTLFKAERELGIQVYHPSRILTMGIPFKR